MIIGGFVKQSFLDWEGQLSAVIFTRGCNFRCAYCHNPSLVIPSLFNDNDIINIDEIIDYLIQRQQWLDAVVITGGEPTIHKDLPDLIKIIKDIGYKIKLDTNGTNPSMLKYLLDNNMIDFVAMDIKNVLSYEDYNRIINVSETSIFTKVMKSIEILRNASIPVLFRTTLYPYVHDDQDKQKIAKLFKNDKLIFQEYRESDTVENYI